MGQMTLGGKPKVDTPKSEPSDDNEDINDTEEIVKDIEKDSGWSDPINRKALDQEKEKGVSWEHLQLMTTSNLKDGTVRKISISHTSEERDGIMGGCYGSGGDVDIKNPKPYFDELMQQKLESQKEPYKDFPNGKEEWDLEDVSEHSTNFYRTIPISNYIVIMGKKLKELLKENGFDFDQWYAEYMAIEENEADEKYNKKVITAKGIMLQESQLLKKAELFRESIRYKLGERQNGYCGGATKDCFPERGLDDLHKELKQLANEVRVMDDKLKGMWINDFGRRHCSDYVLYGAKEAGQVIR